MTLASINHACDDLAMNSGSRVMDVEAMCNLGLPLMPSKRGSQMLSKQMLLRHLESAIASALSSREREAITALVLALRCHYPSVYERLRRAEPAAESLLQSDPDGRVIKLARVARALVAEYL